MAIEKKQSDHSTTDSLMTMKFLIPSSVSQQLSAPTLASHAHASGTSFTSIPSTYSPNPSLNSFVSMNHLSMASLETPTSSPLTLPSLASQSTCPVSNSELFSQILQDSTESITLLNGSIRLGWLYFRQKLDKKTLPRSLQDWSSSLALRLGKSESLTSFGDASSSLELRMCTLSSSLSLSSANLHHAHEWHDLPESQSKNTRLFETLKYYHPNRSFQSTLDTSYSLCRVSPESDMDYEILFAVLLEDISTSPLLDVTLDLYFEVTMSFSSLTSDSDAHSNTHSSTSWHGHAAFPILNALVQGRHSNEQNAQPLASSTSTANMVHFKLGPIQLHYLSMFTMTTPRTRTLSSKAGKSPATNLSTTLDSRTSLLLSNGSFSEFTPVQPIDSLFEQKLLYFDIASSAFISGLSVSLNLMQLIVHISENVYDRLQLEDWTLYANGHDRFAIAHPILGEGVENEFRIWLVGEYQTESVSYGNSKFIKFISIGETNVA